MTIMMDKNGRRLSDRQIERRETILSVTLEMLAKKGYSGVTMDDLAAASGVTKRTLYDIYGSKDALLSAVVSKRMLELLDRIEAGAKGRGLRRLLTVIRMTIGAVLEYPVLARSLEPILLRDPGNFTIGEFFNRLHRRCLVDLAEDGGIAAWADIDFLVANMMIDQIAVQNFWAADIIANAQLESFALLSACRILLPVANGQTQLDLNSQIRRLQARIGKWPAKLQPGPEGRGG